ncbi:MAG: hypothetical protein R6U46_04445 [Marinilabilia sp.]
MNINFIRILFFILFIHVGWVMQAQETSASSDEAVKLFENRQYAEALPLFEQLIQENDEDPGYSYYYGVCLVEQQQDNAEAIQRLEFALSKRENRDAHFYLGQAYQQDYQFEKAIEEFNEFLDYASGEDPRRETAKRAIRDCESAEDHIDKHFDATVLKKDTVPEDEVLSAYALPGDAGELAYNKSFFKTGVSPENIMYRTEKNDEVFFVLEENDTTLHDIYRMERLLDSWSDSKNLGEPVNSDHDDRTPFLMADGTTFFFASDRPGGMGGLDIYQSIYDPESNSFSEPENLGPPFNSPADDYLFAADPFDEKAWFATNRGAEPGNVVVATIRWDDSVIKNLTDSIEQIQSISQLPLKEDTTNQDDAPTTGEETPLSGKTSSPGSPAQFQFQVNDTLVYTHYENFLSDAAKAEFKRGRSVAMKKDSLEQLMRHKRQKYSQSYNQDELNQLIDEILELEEKVYGHDDQAKRHYIRARQIETEEISKLIEKGEYQNLKKEKKKTPASSGARLRSEDFTFYNDQEFNDRSEKLSEMYQDFFKPHQIETLQRTDSMYTWAKILKLEASKLLEESANNGNSENGESFMKRIKRIKTIDSLMDADIPEEEEDILKEAGSIEKEALRMYHKALDTKYTIYRPVMQQMTELSDESSIDNAVNKAQSYFEEANEEVEKMHSWNPGKYEKMGSIKRQAIELLESELLNIPASQANSLTTATSRQTNDESAAEPTGSSTPRGNTTNDLLQDKGKTEKTNEKPDTVVKTALGVTENEELTEEEQNNEQPVYKIQIGVFSNQPDEEALSSLPEISSEPVSDRKITKYFAGKWSSYNEATDHLEEVRNNGFPGAFVVAFYEGEQIPLTEAREMSNEE